jgi:hypothetical protein
LRGFCRSWGRPFVACNAYSVSGTSAETARIRHGRRQPDGRSFPSRVGIPRRLSSCWSTDWPEDARRHVAPLAKGDLGPSPDPGGPPTPVAAFRRQIAGLSVRPVADLPQPARMAWATGIRPAPNLSSARCAARSSR